MNSSLLRLTWLGAAAGALAASNLVMPVLFLQHAHGMLLEMRTLQLIPVYGTAWVIYFILGGLAGAFTGLISASVQVIFRLDQRESGKVLALWILSSVLVFALVKSVLGYLEGGVLERIQTVWTFRGAKWALAFGLSVWLVSQQAAMLVRLRSFLKGLSLIGLLAFGATLLTSIPDTEPRADQRKVVSSLEPPPVVLITIDTLAANHVSLNGYARETTPFLDKLGRSSVVFDHHYSNSNFTTSSISSILNGSRPWSHRVLHLTSRPTIIVAENGLLPLAKRVGYRTSTITTNVWASPVYHRNTTSVVQRSYAGPYWPLSVFPEYLPQAGSVVYLFQISPLLSKAYQFLLEAFDADNLHFDPARAFAQARRLLDNRAAKGSPEFLWVHLLQPHDPYAAAAPFLGTFEHAPQARRLNNSSPPFGFQAGQKPEFPGVFAGRYDEAVLSVDYHIGQFVDWLRQQGRFDDALIVITADHGESFSHGYGTHGGPLLHEDLIHVPLLIKLPHQQVGKRVATLTEHADLLPTILDFIGQPVPEHVEGRSLKPLLEGGTLEPRPIYSMNFEQNSVFLPLTTGTVAEVDGPFKYVHYFGNIKYSLMPKLDDSLYDLSADPDETKNLVLNMPERAAKMLASIQAQIGAHSRPIRN